MRYVLLLILASLIFCPIVYAAPSIDSVSGDTISGSSLGSHADYNTSRDYLARRWNDFNTDLTDNGQFLVEFEENFGTQWELKSTGGRSGNYGERFYKSDWTGGNQGRGDERGGIYYEFDDTIFNGLIFVSVWCKPSSLYERGKFIRGFFDEAGTANAYLSNHASSTPAIDWAMYGVAETVGGTNVEEGTANETTPDEWFRIDWLIDGTATDGQDSGTVTVWKDGVQLWTRADMLYTPLTLSGAVQHLNLGYTLMDELGEDNPTDAVLRFDDYYVSYTQARVEVGNSSTFSGSSHREIQLSETWSATEITVTYNQGSFANYETAYLFVVDSTGTASEGMEGYFLNGTFYSGTVPISATMSGSISISGGVTIN